MLKTVIVANRNPGESRALSAALAPLYEVKIVVDAAMLSVAVSAPV